jgi:hypothetical protein
MHTVSVRQLGAKIMQNQVRCFLLPRSELCKIRRSNNKQEAFLDGRIARHSPLIEIFFLLLIVLLFHIEITRISPHDEDLQNVVSWSKIPSSNIFRF